MSPLRGVLETEVFDFDADRTVTVYVPPDPPESVVYASDGGWHIERLARTLEDSMLASTMVVGVHGLADDEGRLHEYVEAFGGERFEAFERFFVDDVGAWVQSDLDVRLPPERTAVWGASLGGELALAMGLRHPEIFGAILCASPGGGFAPSSAEMSNSSPRTYLVAGRQEPWFLANAMAWADSLSTRGVDVVIETRDDEHGGSFWYDEFPSMISWALRG